MRIGFLNGDGVAISAEDAFEGLRVAAQAIGHEVIACGSSEAVEACRPDFVLAAAPRTPKLADVPHYAVVHEPRDAFLTDRDAFMHLLTHDGFLTLSDTMHRFLRDASYGAGRTEPVGCFSLTPPRRQPLADLRQLIRRRKLVLTYSEQRGQRDGRFLALLGDSPPTHVERNASAGNTSVRNLYAAHGIGVCLADERFRPEDLVPLQLFDIVSMGSIAICGDLPWIRRRFGDSVYYVDQTLPDVSLASALRACVDQMYEDPDAAIERAERARRIFDGAFSAEALLQQAVAYHKRLSACRRSRRAQAEAMYNPLVSVVVRCGGRPLWMIRRTVRSLAEQTYGRFEVVFVRHRPIDLGPVLAEAGGRICSSVVVDAPGGGRSAALWEGLRTASGDYFAVLDDDDWLFRDHFERLFQPLPRGPQRELLAYSGSITQHASQTTHTGAGERRCLFRFAPCRGAELAAWSAEFASNCFVASTDLLSRDVLEDPQMSTGEDSYLVLSLIARAAPRFSFASTAVHERGRSDQSDGADQTARFEDELTLHMRLFGVHRPAFATRDSWGELAALWNSRTVRTRSHLDRLPERLVYRVRDCALSVAPDSATVVSNGFATTGSEFVLPSHAEDAAVGAAVVHCPEMPWSYGAILRLQHRPSPARDCLLVAELLVQHGEVGLGLLNTDEDDFLFRRSFASDGRVHEVHVPVPDLTRVGRLVIQNWERPGRSAVALKSIRVLARPV